MEYLLPFLEGVSAPHYPQRWGHRNYCCERYAIDSHIVFILFIPNMDLPLSLSLSVSSSESVVESLESS